MTGLRIAGASLSLVTAGIRAARLMTAGLITTGLMVAGAMAQDRNTATATFIDRDGQEVGTANLTDTPLGVLIELDVSGLPADQWVAFHVHETGMCDPATDHESAGDHFDPTAREHGYLAEGGAHAGDMPNQFVRADGTLRAHVFNAFVRLGEGTPDITGRSLVIHAGEDDYVSQPSGEAGDRLVCAVIE